VSQSAAAVHLDVVGGNLALKALLERQKCCVDGVLQLHVVSIPGARVDDLYIMRLVGESDLGQTDLTYCCTSFASGWLCLPSEAGPDGIQAASQKILPNPPLLQEGFGIGVVLSDC
jgi:hypothetical protein